MDKQNIFLTAEQAKAVDEKLRQRLGISTIVLMENAGRSVAEEALAMHNTGMKVAILCGKGNNGGDGFVACRHLAVRGIASDVFLAGSRADVRNEARANLDILAKLGQKITEVDNAGSVSLKGYGLIIDALLGVGLAGEVKGLFSDLINLINGSSPAAVLAVDIPSGLDATTGSILGVCVRAKKTVTFIAPKRGMTIGEGPKVCGEIVVRDLGLPVDAGDYFVEK